MTHLLDYYPQLQSVKFGGAMFIDANKVLVNITGRSFKRPTDPDYRPAPGEEMPMTDLTLGYVIIEAVLMASQDGKLVGSVLLDRYQLAQKFFDAVLPVEISNTDAETIKGLIVKRWQQNVQIAGQALDMIKNAPTKPLAVVPAADPSAS